jgi:hypothetical protein
MGRQGGEGCAAVEGEQDCTVQLFGLEHGFSLISTQHGTQQ